MFEVNKKQLVGTYVVAISASIFVLGSILSNSGYSIAYAYDWWDNNPHWWKHMWFGDYGRFFNDADQSIDQSQYSSQDSQCVSGGDTSDSCNNLNVQNQHNSGNNALAQDGGHGHRGHGNSASQEIGQSQYSSQDSQCVSGGDTSDSCNNMSFQNQDNSGNNALAQR